jgi:SOS-response transcriptional repressor LexA
MEPGKLTDLERDVLEYLVEYLRANTYQPSIREIGQRFGIRSTKTVSELLQSLAQKGWVERDPSRSRGVRLLGLDLATRAVVVPCIDDEAGGSAAFELDRRIAGNTGGWLMTMPDGSLTAHGIHRRDLLLVEPLDDAAYCAAGDFLVWRHEAGCRVTCHDGGDLRRAPFGHRLVGRIISVVRRLKAPSAAEPPA